MEFSEFNTFLLNYTEDELFYKGYYTAKKDPATYQEFMSRLDMDFIKKHHILLPELEQLPDFMPESSFMDEHINTSLLKHYRYTPAFLHEHVFFEMFYVYSGTCQQSIAGETQTFQTGDLCIIAPGTRHALSVFDDSIVLNILICKSTFNETFFELLKGHNILSAFFQNILYSKEHQNYLIFHTGIDQDLRVLLFRMFNEYNHLKKYSRTIIDHLLIVFFANLLQNHEQHVDVPQQDNDESRLVLKILLYIENNSANITLETISQEFHFSTAYLSRMIRKNTGYKYTDILKDIRMKKACDLLCTTQISIQSIAEMIGYSSQEHFIRTFKKVHGISPNTYRKNHTRS